MAFAARRVSVDNTAGGALITAGLGGGGPQGISDFAARVKNTHATLTLYLGPSGLTSTTGYPLLAGESISVGSLGADDQLYGLASGAGPILVQVLEVA